MRSETSGDTRFWGVLTASVLVAASVAVLIIPFPFGGDQSLFSVYARMISEGSTLYADVWDVKQPGIFWFFLLAGSIGGFDEISAHLLEASWWLGGSVLVALGLRSVLARRWIAGLFPLMSAGLYFGVARSSDLTQIEPVVSLLVFGVTWLLYVSDKPGWVWQAPVIAGFLTGVIAVFKLLAVLAPFVVLFLVLFRRWRERGSVLRPIWILVYFALGASIPLLAVLSWVAANGLADIVWFTWFEYPGQVLGVNPRPLPRLFRSSWTFAVLLAPLIALALARVIRPSKRGRDLTTLTIGAVAGGTLLIVLQLWWTYTFFVLVVPLAVLAIQGLDDLLDRSKRTLGLGLLLIALLLLPAGYRLATRANDFTSLLSGSSLEEYQSFNASYQRALEGASLSNVEPGSPIYVLGNPSIMYVLGADQSIPINGWSPELWTQELWERVAEDLETSDTEALYLSNFSMELSRERTPWFEERIRAEYVLQTQTEHGQWFQPSP